MKTRIHLVAALAVLAIGSVAHAVTITWTNTAGGNWSDTTSWNPNQTPGAEDIAIITAAGNYTVTLDTSPTVAGLVLGGVSGTQIFSVNGQTFTLNGTAAIGAHGQFNLNNGTLSGTNVLVGTLIQGGGTLTGEMTVSNNSVLNIAGGSVSLYALTLTNNGTVNWTNTTISTGVGCEIYNNGTWNEESDDTFYGANEGAPATVFNNSGTFLKSGNGGATTLESSLIFNNTGLVNVEGGTLLVQDSLGVNSGSGYFDTATGATLDFTAGYTFVNGATFAGGGNVLLPEGAAINGTIIAANLQLTGGTMSGTNVLVGTLIQGGGTLTGEMTVSNNSVLNIAGGSVSLYALTLTNNGTVNWTNTTISTGVGCEIYNNGTWNEESDDTFYGANEGAPATVFNNSGTFLKSGNGGATTLESSLIFNNTGLVNVEGGTLLVQDSLGVNSGSGYFDTATGATLDFTAGYTFVNGATFAGGGNVLLPEGAAINGTIIAANLQLTGGTMSGTNVLVGTLIQGGGTLTGEMTVSNNSVLNIAGGSVSLYALTLTNNGTVNWTNTTISTGVGCEIYNNGTWNEESDDTFYGANEGAPATVFNNSGTFLKSGNGGATTLESSLIFNNTGLVNVEGGTLLVQDSLGVNSGSGYFDTATGATLDFTAGYTFVNGATFAGGGNVLLPEGAAINGTIIAANLQLTGGTMSGTNVLVGTLIQGGGTLTGEMTVSNNSVLNIAGGSVSLYALTLTNNGTVNWTNTTISTGVGCEIYNNGTWNEESDDTFYGANEGAPATVFNNSGTFLKSGNGGATTLESSLIFNNTGTVDAQSGIINMANYTLTGGRLNFGINSLTNFGQISLSGNPATLDGTFSANLNNGYYPVSGNSFPVLSYSSQTGTFTNFVLPSSQAWSTNYGATVFTLTVLNSAPILPGQTNVTINELTTLTVTNTAADFDVPANTLMYSFLSAPVGANISASGVITWTPTEPQGPSTNTFTTRVVDNGSPSLSATNTFTVIVNEVNVAPVLPVIAQTNVNELTTLTVTNTATDSDMPVNLLTYTLLQAPINAVISTNGVITWTPSQTQSPGTNTITTMVTDTNVYAVNSKSLSATNSFTVIVKEVNVAPVLPVIAQTNVNELTLLTVANVASESNIHSAITGYGLISPPAGMSINSSGVITWTPDQTQSPGTNTITTVVTNSNPYDLVNPHLTATNSFTVIVKEINVAPSLPVIAQTNVNELTLLTVADTATNANIHSTNSTYTLISPPVGMTISANGIITWTPGQTQSPGTNTITTVITNSNPYDLVNPHLTATNSFTLIVKEVNVAPTLPVVPTQTVNELALLTVTNVASESNIHASTSGYTLINPPTGMSISGSGIITWTPTEVQGPSTNVIATVVTNTDSFDTITPQLTATNMFTVIVNEVNSAPVLPVQTNVTINELTMLTVTNTATDSDIPTNVLAYSLLSPPAGAAISSSGIITWTPTEAQGPGTNDITTVVTDNGSPSLSATNTFTVVVNEVNVAPVLTVPVSTNINELATLTVTNTATDSDIPANTLTFSLLSPLSGMTINATNGVFTWTPSEAQGPSTNTITVVVTDTNAFAVNSRSLSATNIFIVTVNEVNTAPVLPTQADLIINAGTTLTVTNTATDSDIPANTLAYSLLTAPGAASISTNGIITWVTTAGDGSSTNIFKTRVTDNGSPNLSATNSFIVIVTAVNVAPPVLSIALTSGSGVTTNGSGVFVLTSSPGVGHNPVSVTAFTNADGSVDLVCANNNDNTLLLLTNNGSGIFSSNAIFNVRNAPSAVTAADVNGDGKVDLICANINNGTPSSGNNGTLTVLTNNGGGGFGSNATYNVGSYPTAVTTADVNNDGKPDLICANFGNFEQSTLSVLTNNGSGIFTTTATINVGGANGIEAQSVTAADVNRDGWVDLICVDTGPNNSPGTNLLIFTNNHSGGFTLASSPIVGSGPISVTAADVNNDGWADLICANNGSGNGNTLSVLTNNLSGGFALASSPVVGHGVHSVTAADVNNDGWMDLICANANDGTLSVLTNNRSGGFVLAGSYPLGVNPVFVTAADVNRDGGMDLISANGGGNTLSVLTNTPAVRTTTVTAVVISWPSPSTGFVLQQNGNLATTNWTNFGGTIGDNGTTKSATNSPATGNLFFRLKQ